MTVFLQGLPGGVGLSITFDVTQLGDDGLRGQPDGRRALAYEFRIPGTPEGKTEVAAIDPTIEFMCGSRGRIGCAEDECLCAGSTQRREFREVLCRLAELPYVERIDEAFFE